MNLEGGGDGWRQRSSGNGASARVLASPFSSGLSRALLALGGDGPSHP